MRQHNEEALNDLEPRRARDWFRFMTGNDDEAFFRDAYLGHYASRSAFGEHLLDETYAASQRLQQLPATLRAYVRLDTEQVVTDWEGAGHFIVCADEQDEPSSSVYVFDAHGIGAIDRVDA